jgi:CDP-diacylglycerol--serine O-phosphatidyltransferase
MNGQQVKVVLPSIVTLGNLLCGFLAIANVIEGTPGAMISAAWWIIIAGILDALDGKVARLTGTSSKFGIEFDSIADVVSFGVAPASLFYRYSLDGSGKVGLALGFMFLAAGALRLARFNISATTGSKNYFTGMPIPAGGGILASFVLFSENVWNGLAGFDFAAVLIILTSLAMISRFRYGVMPKIGFRSRKSSIKSVLFLGNVILIVFFPDEVFFPEGLLYLISGPVRYLMAPAFFQVFHRTDNTGVK